MVLPVCGKRGQGGEINSKFAEECEPVSGLCSVCQNSVINAVASLPCHFHHQPSPAQQPLQMKQLWLSSDSENKTIFHCPPCPLSRLLSHILLQVVWEHDFSFTFKRKLWRIIWLRKTFSCSCYEVSDWMLSETVCGVQAAWSSLEAAGREETIMRLQAWIIFHQVEN